MTVPRIWMRTIFLTILVSGLSSSNPYYGTPLGTFATLSNQLKGEIFAVDEHTIFIKKFGCDGICEGAVFWTGTSEHPDTKGFIIPNDISKLMPLPSYINQDVTLHLPKDKNIQSLRWLAVWNENSAKSLGTLNFSNTLQPPHPIAIGPLVNTKRGVSTGDILVLDTRTILVPEFRYNGLEKETYWWLSKGTRPSNIGIRLANVSEAPLQENNTVLITLPKGHLVADYDTLSVWSKNEEEDLGFVDIPKNLNVPPSPHTLGKEELEMDEFNCEMLNDNLGLEVRWLIKGDVIIIHLVGNIGTSEYMGLGLSKDYAETRFDSADAIVVGIDADGKSYAVDYFFESNKYEKGRRMCPDTNYGSVNDVELLQGERRGSSGVVIFKRRLRAEDNVYDQNIYTDGPQSILWAVGQLLPDECADTPTLQSRGSVLLDFGREPNWNCPPPIAPSYSKQKSHYIHCPSNRSFRAQLGSSSSNDKKIWFLNGLSVPEITVQRGNTYTFIVEGGLRPPIHHPFYITDSKEGGLYKKILEEKETLEVTFAGIDEDPFNGTIIPTAEGRLCDWSYVDKGPEYSVVTPNRNIKATLALKCEPGEPGRLLWIPSADTPDIVYYQSFMERNLGGKIHVVDFCEESNPHRYLEITTKGGKSKNNPPHLEKEDLERESEANVFFLRSNSQDKGSLNSEEIRENEEKENLDESIPTELIRETFTPKLDKHSLLNNVINSFRISPDHLNENVNASDNQLIESTTSPSLQTAKTFEEVFPHDESERSDTYLPQHEMRKTVNHEKITLNSPRNIDQSVQHPTYSSSDIISSSASAQLPPKEFRPHFEGGFVPLVMNPMKDKEFVQKKEFIYPPQYQNRPRRPFLYNESVPFHETFKPGVPDFSGFNISNYSQEDDSIIIAHNQDLPVLSASKPQPIHKPFPPIGPIPMHFLQYHNEPLHKPQRAQNFGPIFRQKNPSIVVTHKNLFPSLPVNHKPNFPFPNIRDEDLTLVSSQRVYTSLQAAGDKNYNPGHIQQIEIPTIHNRKIPNSQQNKVSYPPIQRRPDFYEQKEANIPHSNAPQRNFNIAQISSNANKHIPLQSNLHIVQSGGMQRQVNTRLQERNPKLPHNSNLPGNIEKIMVPPGSLRHTHSAMQVLHRPLQVPNFQKEIPSRPNSSKAEKILNESSINTPQNTGNKLPVPIHVINQKLKLPQESQESAESQEIDSSSMKEHRLLPLLINAELVEISNRNVLQNFVKDRPAINPSLMMQNLPVLGPLNAITANSNIRNPQARPNVPQVKSNQKNLPHEIASPAKSFNASRNENMPSSQMNNKPLMSQVYETFIPNSGINMLPIFSDHLSEIDTSDRSESIAIATGYENYDVPFGARLKFPQNGSKIPVRPINQILRIPSGQNRRPQTHFKNTENIIFNSESKQPELLATTNTSPFAPSTKTTATATTSTTTTTEATLVVVKNIANIYVDNNRNISFETEDNQKKLHETPVYLPHIINYSANINKHSVKSDEVKHVPFITDTSKDTVDTKYLGRKNNFSHNSSSSFPSVVVPPRISEDINLPQISENPPTHDNRTDYSILNHVLTLIGGQSDQNERLSS